MIFPVITFYDTHESKCGIGFCYDISGIFLMDSVTFTVLSFLLQYDLVDLLLILYLILFPMSDIMLGNHNLRHLHKCWIHL
ncbi:unnamed protein product [Parnassius mnemosyne]|uniref:Uncharacterized protein n=1 Tax=Parnassius mnemosyne TaxID=213953 RepID=A0AAV1LEC4_9NEOP